jgi:hypothetical protein
MEYLLSKGADGYYIKESPEVIVSDEFSKENFENLVNTSRKCIEKEYLKEYFLLIEKMKQHLKNDVDNTTFSTDFINNLVTQFDFSYTVIHNAKNELGFMYAYIALYRCLEIIASELKSYAPTANKIKFQRTEVDFQNCDFDYDNNPINFRFTSSFLNIANSPVNKIIIGLAKEHLQIPSTNSAFFEKICWATWCRNKCIHPPKRYDTWQQNELDKVFNNTGFSNLLEILEQIILNIP